MPDIVVGILAIVIGAIFCFRGLVAMRFVIAIWGAFAGLNLGAGLVSAINGDEYLATPLGWVVGIFFALAFSVLAYMYYTVAVVLTMASVGFILGAGVMVAFGVSWNWVVILVGVLIGLGLAVLTLTMDLPAVLLVVLSVLAGAVAVVGGAMLLVDTLNTADFDQATLTENANTGWWWYALYVVLVILGAVTQIRTIGKEGSLRQQW